MADITILDLEENIDLDADAMSSIAGGGQASGGFGTHNAVQRRKATFRWRPNLAGAGLRICSLCYVMKRQCLSKNHLAEWRSTAARCSSA